MSAISRTAARTRGEARVSSGARVSIVLTHHPPVTIVLGGGTPPHRPIIPAAGAGVDDQYLSLIDGYRTARRLGLPKKMMLFFGVGPLGLFPFSPPFPVKITLHLGRPIPPEGDAKSEKDVQALHARVVGAVEVLLDKVREENCAGALYQPEDATWA